MAERTTLIVDDSIISGFEADFDTTLVKPQSQVSIVQGSATTPVSP